MNNNFEKELLAYGQNIEPLMGDTSVTIQSDITDNVYSAGTIDETMLSDEEKDIVKSIADEIDITNVEQIMRYGVTAQKGISDFSVSILKKIKTKELGEVGDSLRELTVFLDSTTAPEKKGIGGFFQRTKRKIDKVRANYEKAETNVKKIEKSLEEHQVTLAKDISLYEQMYDLNARYYRDLTLYIISGKKILDSEKNGKLIELKTIAEETDSREYVELYRQRLDMCNRFEKKLHDLELSRIVSLQMAPQLRMLQNNDQALFEKIQSSLLSTIPLWRNQVVIQLGLEHTKRAIAAQNAITDATNNLIKENAEALRIAAIETAAAAERPVIDIETLRKSNRELIASISEVLKIHEAGAKQRKDAQEEMLKIENELKEGLRNIIK